ncbi:diguanylate cyclase [Mycolicibacterium sp. CH28]|uniref:GGDEF domain-containing protein n=1 Tax=Mycolicibacterium sp. CH28 TaxID=2512237 RepID=UPI0013871C8A|nr:GGDEF domain-containing protein [Mycolicibacterium sp. CH28]
MTIRGEAGTGRRIIDALSDDKVELAKPYLPLIRDSAETLAEDFYATLLQRPEAHRYLDHSVVENRLKAQLVDWIRGAFSVDAFRDAAAFEARQERIGDIHARMKIPVHLLNIGALRLCSQIAALVRGVDAPWGDRFDAMRLFEAWIGRAIAAMTRSGVDGMVERTRVEEAYRLFSLDQDMNLERERQRASLLEWSQETLFSALHSQPPNGSGETELASAPFGRWTRHRAEMMFGSAPQLLEINDAIARVDGALLPAVRNEDAVRRVDALQALGVEVDRILALIGDLFQGQSELETGRDPLTRTLNRRFLPAILQREIGFANRTSLGLAVLMVDVDHFKSVNEAHGHQAGDAVIRTLAGVLADNVRSTDFVFRYGGEEFLVLLAESGRQDSVTTAERIRKGVTEARFGLGDLVLDVTVSIGVAVHDGHPDPDELVNRADKALREAKHSGRNQVVLASATANN